MKKIISILILMVIVSSFGCRNIDINKNYLNRLNISDTELNAVLSEVFETWRTVSGVAWIYEKIKYSKGRKKIKELQKLDWEEAIVELDNLIEYKPDKIDIIELPEKSIIKGYEDCDGMAYATYEVLGDTLSNQYTYSCYMAKLSVSDQHVVTIYKLLDENIIEFSNFKVRYYDNWEQYKQSNLEYNVFVFLDKHWEYTGFERVGE